MPTVGNTAKPTTTQEMTGLNTGVAMAQLITMPAGGPWIITSLGAWFAGVNQQSDAALCVWSAGGGLLAYSGRFTVANGGGLAVGASVLHTAGISLQVSGGQQIYVGWHRNPGATIQNGRYSSGSHLHDVQGGSPEALSGFSTDSSGAIGAFVNDCVTAHVAP